MIKFIKARNGKLIAEGVETKEELFTLIRLGVDYVQGYYLGRPEYDVCKEISYERKMELIEFSNKTIISPLRYNRNNDSIN